MKYLKLYTQLNEGESAFKYYYMKRDINYFLKKKYELKPDWFLSTITQLDCSKALLNSLNGIEKLINLEYFYCNKNRLRTLKGIENCKKLKILCCYDNKLENLHGIENLTELVHLDCSCNRLNDLDELLDLPKLDYLYSVNNPFEFPIQIEIFKNTNKGSSNQEKMNRIYGEPKEDYKFFGRMKNLHYWEFQSHWGQKNFLKEHPERVKDLEPFGYHPKIKEEFKHLIVGKEWGFFDLEGGSA